jgi:hypothetical protein
MWWRSWSATLSKPFPRVGDLQGNLAAKAGHDRWVADACADAEVFVELGFYPTLG